MIIPVKKYLILGAREDIDRFFERAQVRGIIEFISPHGKKPIEAPPEVQHLFSAMKILRKLPVKKPYIGGGDLPFAEEVAQKIIDLKAEVERLSEERRMLENEIVRVGPFGDFSLDDIDYIERKGKCEAQFFCMKTAKANIAQFGDEVIYLGTDYDLDYFMAINKKPRHYPDMIEMRIDRPLGELQVHLAFVKESLHQIEAELKGYAGHLDFLHEAFVERLNEYHLAAAKKEVSFPMENAVFTIEAWIPANKINVLFSIVDGMAIHCEPILVEEEDRIPTYMENKGVNRIGEDLVKIYDIPAATDKDPSGWVFWFFTLFFAMIVADAGYGLMYLGLCLYFKFRYRKLQPFSKRFLNLATILSTACVIWGIATAAIFGIEFSPRSAICKASFVQKLAIKKADYHLAQHDDVYQFWATQFPSAATANSGTEYLDLAVISEKHRLEYPALDAFSDSILLEISLMIGIVHISLSLLRYLLRHWAGIGWVIFMVGGYLYFPLILKATSMINFLGVLDKTTSEEIGLQLIVSGIAIAMLLSLLQKRLKGIGEIATMVQVFADVLSYLRLYALGLAGVIMAETFNGIGEDVGLVFGSLIILMGHSVNVMLGLMAGMIHGLRLNFIEWYHFSFEGGGKLFNPLMLLKAKEHI